MQSVRFLLEGRLVRCGCGAQEAQNGQRIDSVAHQLLDKTFPRFMDPPANLRNLLRGAVADRTHHGTYVLGYSGDFRITKIRTILDKLCRLSHVSFPHRTQSHFMSSRSIPVTLTIKRQTEARANMRVRKEGAATATSSAYALGVGCRHIARKGPLEQLHRATNERWERMPSKKKNLARHPCLTPLAIGKMPLTLPAYWTAVVLLSQVIWRNL